MIRQLVGAIIFSTIVLIVGVEKRAYADPRCQQLEALHARYAGVELTSEQKQLKQKMVAWYYSHCRERHIAGEG